MKTAAHIIILATAIIIGATYAARAQDAAASDSPVAATQTAVVEPEPAGSFPATVTLQVTGHDIPEEFLDRLAEEAIMEKIRIKSGCSYVIGTHKAKYQPGALAGESSQGLVPVEIWGSGYRTVRGNVIVMIENIKVEGFNRADAMFISNSPESFPTSGELLRGTFKHGSSSRFMIHHRNADSKEHRLIFFVRNSTDEPALLRVVGDIFDPWPEAMIAGHHATLRFHRAVRNGVGYLIEIPAGKYATLRSVTLKHDEVGSGLCEIQVLRGKGVDFSIRAQDMYMGDAYVGQHIGNPNTKRAHGEYATPYKEVAADFTVGDKWTFVSLGNDYLQAVSTPSPPLHGNYGVTYDITLNVTNPFDTEEQLEFVFAPAGGTALGSFYIDGKQFVVKHTRAGETPTIAKVDIGPKEKKVIQIETLPESGSFYPVKLIMRSRFIQ